MQSTDEQRVERELAGTGSPATCSIVAARVVSSGIPVVEVTGFVKVVDADPVVDWDLVERARYAAGWKGYADAAVMPRSVGSLLVTLGGGAGSSA